LLERATDAPPEGAAPFSFTVPVEPAPPTRLVGLRATESRSGLTVRVAFLVTDAYTAVTVR
jgi:hypothetical protein